MQVPQSCGAVAVVELRMAPTTWDSQLATLILLRDITDHKRADKALRESEARYRHIAETASEGIWTVDTAGPTTYVDQCLAAMLGYDPTEMVGHPVTDFVFPDDLAEVERALAKSGNTEQQPGNAGRLLFGSGAPTMQPMSHQQHRRVHIITLGCPKNEVDSEAIREQLADNGYRVTSHLERADCIIVNTCGFLEAAREEAVSALRRLAAGRRPGQRLIAAGCLAQREGAALARAVPGLDGVIGVRSWRHMPALLDQITTRAARRRQPVFHLPETGSLPDEDEPLRRDGAGRRASAYLKIADGCSATCAFCAIPAIKGPARSRPRETILQEARALVNLGAREIILIAQDTTAYGRDRGERDGLPALVADIVRVAPEVRWLRLMYAYPALEREQGIRLVETIATHPQVCHYLDIPVQHGHPDTLRRMRRPADVAALLRWIETLRAAVPDIALRTSLIVGYPGETEAEFQGLLDFLQAARFDRAGVFRYSREPGTPAYNLPGQVNEDVKQARYDRAMQHQQAVSLARNQAQLGRRLDVLVEGCGDGISIARSYRDAPEVDGFVLVQSEHAAGTWQTVRVTGATPYDLIAISDQPPAIGQLVSADSAGDAGTLPSPTADR